MGKRTANTEHREMSLDTYIAKACFPNLRAKIVKFSEVSCICSQTTQKLAGWHNNILKSPAVFPQESMLHYIFTDRLAHNWWIVGYLPLCLILQPIQYVAHFAKTTCTLRNCCWPFVHCATKNWLTKRRTFALVQRCILHSEFNCKTPPEFKDIIPFHPVVNAQATIDSPKMSTASCNSWCPIGHHITKKLGSAY